MMTSDVKRSGSTLMSPEPPCVPVLQWMKLRLGKKDNESVYK